MEIHVSCALSYRTSRELLPAFCSPALRLSTFSHNNGPSCRARPTYPSGIIRPAGPLWPFVHSSPNPLRSTCLRWLSIEPIHIYKRGRGVPAAELRATHDSTERSGPLRLKNYCLNSGDGITLRTTIHYTYGITNHIFIIQLLSNHIQDNFQEVWTRSTPRQVTTTNHVHYTRSTRSDDSTRDSKPSPVPTTKSGKRR